MRKSVEPLSHVEAHTGRYMIKTIVKTIAPAIDILILPFVFVAAMLLKMVRTIGVHRLKVTRRVLQAVGVFPLRNHYYEPQFLYDVNDDIHDRQLAGVELHAAEQLQLLDRLVYANEVTDWPANASGEGVYYLNNQTFASGDAEFLYQMIRHLKPTRLYEVGSGYSTLVAIKALQKNKAENPGYHCRHVCIEPYEMPWLEKQGVEVIRRRVEDMDKSFFSDLGENDILFIDSSHVIRPKGDVLFLYLTLLPALQKGVVVHIHDIFTPRNYLSRWLKDEVLFWNEQYLLEAFLTGNEGWKVMAAVNYLHHQHGNKLAAVCPHVTPEREPGSFYIKKVH